jgi:UDPglucose--hexose-1-phosphate uridylyltransferase
MPQAGIRKVVDVWIEQFRELGGDPGINYVQIFENRGAVMGSSNPHPHGQIWASETVPNEPRKEQSALAAYRAARGGCILCDYLDLEHSLKQRIVCGNRHWTALVPFWAVWPFETLLVGKRHLNGLDLLSLVERDALADILRRLTRIYDRLFGISFPYSMGFHQRPCDGREHAEWHLHAHFYPPLLRSASVRKFMVGYELLASPQRDITPESAAERLRQLT